MKPLVYVAGPISSNPMHGTYNAITTSEKLRDYAGVTPFIPHLTVVWDMISPHVYEYWMTYDAEIIQHCDGLFRMEGHSPGADREVQQANSLEIPVFTDIRKLKVWADNWIEVHA